LENLDDDDDIHRAWKSITENINASETDSLRYYELKQHNLNRVLMASAQNY
jgi:hypothetical protein